MSQNASQSTESSRRVTRQGMRARQSKCVFLFIFFCESHSSLCPCLTSGAALDGRSDIPPLSLSPSRPRPEALPRCGLPIRHVRPYYGTLPPSLLADGLAKGGRRACLAEPAEMKSNSALCTVKPLLRLGRRHDAAAKLDCSLLLVTLHLFHFGFVLLFFPARDLMQSRTLIRRPTDSAS